MATRDQRRIIREFQRNMGKKIQGMLRQIPREWDGFELRWWLADLYEEQTVNPKACPGGTGRYRRYRNERLVKGL